MRGVGGGEIVRDTAPLARGRLREPCPKACIAGVHTEPRPCLRICEPHLTDVDELLLARIADLDREYVVACVEIDELLLPVSRAAEVGDDGDERALTGDGTDQRERRGELRRNAATACPRRRGRATALRGRHGPASVAAGKAHRSRTR